ncbi:NAD(P)H-quinone oxidoreductase subunit 5, chloroplastic-like, partial [Zingiber officinale]|uniref:NAD(P)H-quinone oxidoreductase subunit 5, chloroplastic-like n=1 Tax=Zingiber officinale TaxID=94328 RepID=UPI001C4C01AD
MYDPNALKLGGKVYDLNALELGDIVYDPNTLEIGDIVYDMNTWELEGMVYNLNALEMSGTVYDMNALEMGGMVYDSNALEMGGTVYNTNALEMGGILYDPNALEMGGTVTSLNRVDVDGVLMARHHLAVYLRPSLIKLQDHHIHLTQYRQDHHIPLLQYRTLICKFLVARLLPLFISIPYIMNIISLIGVITVLLGATLALAQTDIKRSLAYSTMSQLGYIMLALGLGSYRAALFHLLTHAYSKALLFLGSGAIIHSMEPVVGYSPDKSQNMILMGGLKRYVPITRTTFLLGTLSICGIPPLACFWSKDEILNESWLYSPIFAIIACFTAGLTAFYMFRVYLLTFDGHLRINCKNYSSTNNSSFHSISLWGKEVPKKVDRNFLLSKIENMVFFFSKDRYKISSNLKKRRSYTFEKKYTYTSMYPHESDNTMLFPLFVLVLFNLFVGTIGIHFDYGIIYFDILSKWLTPSTNLLHPNVSYSVDWYEFFTNAIFSVSIAIFGLLIAYVLYGSIYSLFQNLEFINSFIKGGPKRTFLDKIKNRTYNWSYNCGYIDIFYTRVFTLGIRELTKLTQFFDRNIIDGIINGVVVASLFIGEGVKSTGGGRISSYLFLYLFYASIFLFIFNSFIIYF